MNNVISIQMCFRDQVELAIQAYCYRKGFPHGCVSGEMRKEIHSQVARFFKYSSKNLAMERLWSQDDLVTLVGIVADAYEAGRRQVATKQEREQ